jgi:tetratricopeptide (TPR) repeat protein
MFDYNLAWKLYSEGKLYESKKILNAQYQTGANSEEMMFLLAVIYYEETNFEKAADIFNKILNYYPYNLEAAYSLGLCKQELLDNETAERLYKQVLQSNPNHINSLNNLGLILAKTERENEAENCFKKICFLDTNNYNAILNLGNLYLKKHNFLEAQKYYLSALEFNPQNDLILFNISQCFLGQKKYAETILYLKKTLEVNSRHTAAGEKLGDLLLQLGRYQEAGEYFEKLLKINPNNSIGFLKLAGCYQFISKDSLAIENYQKALQLDNELSASIDSKISELNSIDKILAYINSLSTDSKKEINTIIKIAIEKLSGNKLDDSICLLRKAIELDNNNVEAHFTLGWALLKNQQLPEGWLEYEWRKKRDNFHVTPRKGPVLENQSLVNKTVLVYDEQGAGDTLQFIRFLPLLKDKGCRVIFQCNPDLRELCSKAPGYDVMIPLHHTHVPDLCYDYDISLLSLPAYLNIDLESVPPDTNYIFVNQEKSKLWKEALKNSSNLKVGIVWAGNPKHVNDSIRSCPINELVKITAVKNVDFYSLQKGEPVKQLEELDNNLITSLDNYIMDYSDTAAIIDNLDLIISVDTSVAHLAGSMQKKVWNILAYNNEWRWFLNRDDSPWYSSMKLFRQPKPNDWDSLINELIKELSILSANYNIGKNVVKQLH